ncbi:HAD-IA family hydrolase [Jannaschia seohaensis]|uniref:HAD superfamily hydrolase (TIGR01509 family) n=1 Tax=Jannaschia seohaensis TaxID=475081 RepID=A0A2Y9AVJ6_9RHOB|nr:HAD-IA family hydrolase [Jannaschia seohaensis]PWJ17017.1 HAD superfamily hydrolase (TIGR01509 family) [Jannaschia seohaensis]SSA48354.1 haloacid dehalogenase superfamily, subfamily IA, variant 3 with third motif having DD or ED [Jannaschia seohaensis]
MTHTAILFGSIGTLAETSELQRRAYNAAFAAHDLDWVWERQRYYRMLNRPGGRARLADYAVDAGQSVDVDAVHATKERVFASLVDRSGLEPRPGVVETISTARHRGVPVGLCTTTTPAQVGLVLDGLAPHVTQVDFDWVGDVTMVDRPKPAPDIYLAALDALGLKPAGVLAIEDTPESAEAARAAGLSVVGFPGEAGKGRAFPSDAPVVDRLGAHIVDGNLKLAAE